MNKKPYMLLGILLISALSSCQSSASASFYSLSYPSYENSDFDFSYAYGDKRKLAEYQLHREYYEETPEAFTGTLLNPANYPEDEETDAFYQPTGSYDEQDLSEELIEFAPYQVGLADLIDGFPDGEITDSLDLETILDNAGLNDSIITRQEIYHEETALYHDYENGPYYAFNNFHKEETTTLRRYTDPLLSGAGLGIIEYQDGFDDSYSFNEQIRATGYYIYEMHDETFPAGSTSAADYKITTPRVPGNYHNALLLGGGGTSARFITGTLELYDELTNPFSEAYNANYSFELYGMKTSSAVTINLETHVLPHYTDEDEEVYGMDLVYEFVIVEGVVTEQSAFQTYWTNLVA
jgi:hypothetical protein